MREHPVVAIDGPSGVGKSTVAKKLANRLDFAFVDTGALYRATALLAQEAGIDWQDAKALAKLADSHFFAFDSEGSLFVDGEPMGDRIRTPLVSRGSSEVAKHKEVRESLLSVQRRIGKDGGVVLEGRDIGTTVFPDAEVKIFLTADAEIRARRRFLELKSRGLEIELEDVKKDQNLRDERDRRRPISPLRKAEDAIEIDSGNLTVEEVVDSVFNYIKSNFPLTSKYKA